MSQLRRPFQSSQRRWGFLRLKYLARRWGSTATQHFDRVADVPVVLKRQEPIIHTVQKTAEIAHRVADVTIGLQRQAPTIQTEQETVAFLESQFTSRLIGTIPGQVSRAQLQTPKKTVKAQTFSRTPSGMSKSHRFLTAEVVLQISPLAFSDD